MNVADKYSEHVSEVAGLGGGGVLLHSKTRASLGAPLGFSVAVTHKPSLNQPYQSVELLSLLMNPLRGGFLRAPSEVLIRLQYQHLQKVR